MDPKTVIEEQTTYHIQEIARLTAEITQAPEEDEAWDGLPMDFTDGDQGTVWVMAACGHRVGGVMPGDRIALCPNCRFLIHFQSVPVVYPTRLPEGEVLGVPVPKRAEA